jgi:hypothetical protein
MTSFEIEQPRHFVPGLFFLFSGLSIAGWENWYATWILLITGWLWGLGD